MRPSIDDLVLDQRPLNTYGSLESTIHAIRDHRPLDLNAEAWREAHPGGDHARWREAARNCLRTGLHYAAGPLDLDPEVVSREEREDIVVEHVRFNTAPWFRVDGRFLMPRDADGPLPGMVLFHAWGGPMTFGLERVVNVGRDHPALAEHRDTTYSGRYLAEEYARRGYAVIVIDAFHFGQRAPRGVGQIPAAFDPFEFTGEDFKDLEKRVIGELYQGLKQLMWAGTTWMGLLFNDDSRCVDYLLSRPEVDPRRIGCTGLSGGGWRTNVLAALDDRIRASVSVGWMSTGDYQQIYNVRGAVGTFCLLPGVWDRLDLPDFTSMGAPCASMVVVGEQDNLVPQVGIREAARQIAASYEWAGCPERFAYHHPPTPHVYDAQVQATAFDWFARWLG